MGSTCGKNIPFASTKVLSDVCCSSTGLEIKEHVQKQEVANNLPAPPQMPLPEIPQQWLVSVIFNYINIYKRECICGKS